ncbi:hypothetical protein SAMN03159423_0488 [Bradyrhizobium sp. NFR13]|uniref:hypothetical protein n=1 Tax=Bradyrhizobium sp. NFR13 TaxID=1566285 RepID=UPI0008DFBE5F|nr:hypothetical protein [Bradyrhizobium sp. NFR13]SFM29777.1 hypothetical protein SAMN03159423_0488 [Bradyrhizobium sp. NFR13]
MPDFSPSIAPDDPHQPIRSEAETLLEIVAQLGAALIQLKPSDDPVIVDHVRAAHRLALDLYGRSQGSSSFREMQENAP